METTAAPDPFPRDRVTATLRRVPAYLRLAWRLARDPLLSRARRAAVVAAAGYLASPIDLVPGVIPVAGQLDDLAVAIGALRFALAGLDTDRRREHLEAVGLEDHHLAEDLRTAIVASAWLLRAGVRTTGRAARRGGSLARSAATGAGPATKTAVSKAGPAAKSAARKAGPAARSAATRGAGALRGGADAVRGGAASVRQAMAGQPRVEIRVSKPRLPALGPGRRPASDETLRVETETDDTDPVREG